MVTRVEEGGGGGGEKERGALSVAGSRRSLHFGTDVTGLLSRSKKACWLAGWLAGTTSNRSRFSAFNPPSPNGRKKNANLPKALLAVVRRWNGNSEKRGGWNSGGGGDVHVASNRRTLPTDVSFRSVLFVKKETDRSFLFLFLSLSRFSAFEFPATSVRYVRWEKRWWPSTFHGERGGRDETFEAWELRRSYNPRSFPRNPAETVLVGKIRVRG